MGCAKGLTSWQGWENGQEGGWVGGQGLCLKDLDEILGLYPKSFEEPLMNFMEGSDVMPVRNTSLWIGDNNRYLARLLQKLEVIFKALITVFRDGQAKKCTLSLFQILFKTQSGASISRCDYGKILPKA